jgi:hypothetical protein
MKKKTKSNNKGKTIVQLKHKVVLNKLIKDVGKSGKSAMTSVMPKAGYSENYAKSGNIKKTKSWQYLVEKHLSDEYLAITHEKLLVSKQIKQLNFNHKLSDEEIKEILEGEGYTFIGTARFMTNATVFFSVPDGLVIKGALDLAYKVKGKNAPEKFEVEQTGLRSLSDAELAEIIKKQTARFKKTD